MDDDTPQHTDAPTTGTHRLVATDSDGSEADWAEVVRAVFDGDADPDDYQVTLQERS